MSIDLICGIYLHILWLWSLDRAMTKLMEMKYVVYLFTYFCSIGERSKWNANVKRHSRQSYLNKFLYVLTHRKSCLCAVQCSANVQCAYTANMRCIQVIILGTTTMLDARCSIHVSIKFIRVHFTRTSYARHMKEVASTTLNNDHFDSINLYLCCYLPGNRILGVSVCILSMFNFLDAICFTSDFGFSM